MTDTRRYVSPQREAQAAATRQRILEAFRDQLIAGHDALSPSEAAEAAGCSVRTVHGYFPSRESRVEALAEWLDSQLYGESVPYPATVDDLPDHFRRIHQIALGSPLAAALLAQRGSEWAAVRDRRRAARLDAIREVAESVGAPPAITEEVAAVLVELASGEVSIGMRERSGLPDDRICDAIARTVEVLVTDLRARSGASTP